MENKTQIHESNEQSVNATPFEEFYANIYPFWLWVAVNPSFEEFSNRFVNLDWNMHDTHEFDKETYERNRFVTGVTSIVKEREGDRWGAVVRLTNQKHLSAGFLAHEASHICDFMCNTFEIGGFTYELGEPRAYICGWVADCIEGALKRIENGKSKE